MTDYKQYSHAALRNTLRSVAIDQIHTALKCLEQTNAPLHITKALHFDIQDITKLFETLDQPTIKETQHDPRGN